MRDEHTNRVKVVTVSDHGAEVSDRLKKDLTFLDEASPSIELEFVAIEGNFNPKMIRDLAKAWKIFAHLMFSVSPEGKLPYDLAAPGGVGMIV